MSKIKSFFFKDIKNCNKLALVLVALLILAVSVFTSYAVFARVIEGNKGIMITVGGQND